MGTFQDGGLRHNNPINIALWESRYIWDAGTQTDVVLSLGTGSDVRDTLKSPGAPPMRNVISDGFLPRLYRSLMSSLDGENVWRDFKNRLPPDVRDDFFRFNLFLDTREPDIDDIGCLDELQRSVKKQMLTDQTCKQVCQALLVSCFYFELDSSPYYEGGGYTCSGKIRCRINCHKAVEALVQVVSGPIEFGFDHEVLGILDVSADQCSGCSQYAKQVSFRIRHPSDRVAIVMRFNYNESRKISGFPQSLKWFVEQQGLDHSFGRKDIGNGALGVCSFCSSVRLVDGLAVRKRKMTDDAQLHYVKRLKHIADADDLAAMLTMN